MRKEFGKWLMDIAKYMTTAIMLSSIFKQIERLEAFFVCTVMTCCVLMLGLFFIKEEQQVENEKKLDKKK